MMVDPSFTSRRMAVSILSIEVGGFEYREGGWQLLVHCVSILSIEVGGFESQGSGLVRKVALVFQSSLSRWGDSNLGECLMAKNKSNVSILSIEVGGFELRQSVA